MPRANRSKKAESSGRFKPYPAYKDSGVEWLGKIPSHWDVKRLKYAAPARTTRLERKPDDTAYLGLENIESWTGRLLLASAPESVDSVVATFESGDVLFSKLRPYLAKVARPRFGGVCTSEVVPLRPLVGMSQDYVMYGLLNAPYIYWLDSLTYGTKMPRVSPDQLATSPFAVPPVGEQRAIAAFLDRETARIDALVAKKERLLELLQYQRASLMTEAVNGHSAATQAKALSPLPPGWRTRKLRRLLIQVRRPISVDPESEYREIGIRSWGKGVFHKDAVRGALLEDKSVFGIEPGDFVLNIVFAWEGAVAMAGEQERGMVASHRFPTFRFAPDVEPDYLLMFLQTEQGRALMEINSPGAAGRNRTIRLSQFLNEEIPLPPRRQQQEIVREFRERETRIGALTSKIRRAIERLKEYRIALISAAVTGQIDVRGMVDGATSEGGAA